MRQLPGLRKSLYSGTDEHWYFRRHFQDCYNTIEASKVLFESPESANRISDLENFYSSHQDLMHQDPSKMAQKDIELRKRTTEEYARKIYETLNSEVKYLLREMSEVKD